jgi:hypothetical protein
MPTYTLQPQRWMQHAPLKHWQNCPQPQSTATHEHNQHQQLVMYSSTYKCCATILCMWNSVNIHKPFWCENAVFFIWAVPQEFCSGNHRNGIHMTCRICHSPHYFWVNIISCYH